MEDDCHINPGANQDSLSLPAPKESRSKDFILRQSASLSITALAAVRELYRVLASIPNETATQLGLTRGVRGLSQVPIGAFEPLASSALVQTQSIGPL